MTARQEVEEILEQEAWAGRNGLDLYDPQVINTDVADRYQGLDLRPGMLNYVRDRHPAQALAQHEARTYPAADAYDELPFVPVAMWKWLLALAALFVLGIVVTWNFPPTM